MIYTVTLNPSIDYIVSVDSFAQKEINRASAERMIPGGKGINVSVVLHNLGIESVATGFTAGFTGNEVVRLLQQIGVCTDFVHVEGGNSRINVKLLYRGETQINGNGPSCFTERDIEALHGKFAHLNTGDVLVLAGSIPSALPFNLYREIMERLSGKGVRVVVDAAGELLLRTMELHPFLVKPNHRELGELFSVEIDSSGEAIACAQQLQKRGATNVLVSMGSAGAVLLTEDGKQYIASAPGGQAVYTVGAGDSMVAGFLAGYLQSEGDYKEALYMGLCAGSATACSENLATAEEIYDLRKKMEG